MMEKYIKDQAKKNTPDLIDYIKSSVEYQAFVQERQTQRSAKPLVGRLRLATAGAFALVLLLMFFITPNLQQPVYSEVYIEFNPSFTFKLNDRDEVYDITPLNADAETLIANLDDLTNKHIDEALDALLDEAIAQGFIDGDTTTILYDIVGEAGELKERHTALVEQRLETIRNEKLPSVALMAAMGGMPTENERSIVEEHDIGVMHARLIGIILNENPDLEIEDLIGKTLPELRAYLTDNENQQPDYENRPRHPFDDDDFSGRGGPFS